MPLFRSRSDRLQSPSRMSSISLKPKMGESFLPFSSPPRTHHASRLQLATSSLASLSDVALSPLAQTNGKAQVRRQPRACQSQIQDDVSLTPSSISVGLDEEAGAADEQFGFGRSGRAGLVRPSQGNSGTGQRYSTLSAKASIKKQGKNKLRRWKRDRLLLPLMDVPSPSLFTDRTGSPGPSASPSAPPIRPPKSSKRPVPSAREPALAAGTARPDTPTPLPTRTTGGVEEWRYPALLQPDSPSSASCVHRLTSLSLGSTNLVAISDSTHPSTPPFTSALASVATGIFVPPSPPHPRSSITAYLPRGGQPTVFDFANSERDTSSSGSGDSFLHFSGLHTSTSLSSISLSLSYEDPFPLAKSDRDRGDATGETHQATGDAFPVSPARSNGNDSRFGDAALFDLKAVGRQKSMVRRSLEAESIAGFDQEEIRSSQPGLSEHAARMTGNEAVYAPDAGEEMIDLSFLTIEEEFPTTPPCRQLADEADEADETDVQEEMQEWSIAQAALFGLGFDVLAPQPRCTSSTPRTAVEFHPTVSQAYDHHHPSSGESKHRNSLQHILPPHELHRKKSARLSKPESVYAHCPRLSLSTSNSTWPTRSELTRPNEHLRASRLPSEFKSNNRDSVSLPPLSRNEIGLPPPPRSAKPRMSAPASIPDSRTTSAERSSPASSDSHRHTCSALPSLPVSSHTMMRTQVLKASDTATSHRRDNSLEILDMSDSSSNPDLQPPVASNESSLQDDEENSSPIVRDFSATSSSARFRTSLSHMHKRVPPRLNPARRLSRGLSTTGRSKIRQSTSAEDGGETEVEDLDAALGHMAEVSSWSERWEVERATAARREQRHNQKQQAQERAALSTWLAQKPTRRSKIHATGSERSSSAAA